MKTNINKDNKGFTIIEVLIVLAIAGVILLIVFLAVPNLQRNNRNTQKRADINVLGASINEFLSTNAGSLPTAFGNKSVSGGTTTTAVPANTNYYTTATFASGAQSKLTTDEAKVVTGAKCGTAGETVSGTTRQVAIQFTTETAATSIVAQCQDV